MRSKYGSHKSHWAKPRLATCCVTAGRFGVQNRWNLSERKCKDCQNIHDAAWCGNACPKLESAQGYLNDKNYPHVKSRFWTITWPFWTRSSAQSSFLMKELETWSASEPKQKVRGLLAALWFTIWTRGQDLIQTGEAAFGAQASNYVAIGQVMVHKERPIYR